MSESTIPDPRKNLEEWVNWKRRLIGGHAAVTLSGASYSSTGQKHYQSLDQLYDLIVHGIVDQRTEADEEFLEWRLDLEPNIAARYSKKTGRMLKKCGSILHPDNPQIVASPDRRIYKDPKGPGQLEIKSRDPIIWNQIKLNGAPGADWVQTQHYLMVSGKDKFSGICEANVSSGKQINFDIEPDLEFHRILFQRIEKFLDDCSKGIRPQTEAVDPVRLPSVGGELVTIDDLDADMISEFLTLADGIKQSRDLFDRAKEYKDGVDKAAKDWFLANQFDVVEGFGLRVYFKEQAGRAKFDKKGLKKAHPEIDLSRFESRGDPFRSLRIYDRPLAISEKGE